jgi:hypothetical protein
MQAERLPKALSDSEQAQAGLLQAILWAPRVTAKKTGGGAKEKANKEETEEILALICPPALVFGHGATTAQVLD